MLIEKKTQKLGFQFPNQLKYVPSPPAAQFQNPHSTAVLPFYIWHRLLPEPSVLYRFYAHFRCTKHFVFHFIQSRSNTPQAGKCRDHLCLAIYDVTIGLFSLPRRMFVSQAVLQRDTTLTVPYPIQDYFLFLFSPSFISSSCREQIPKSTPQALSRNFQERKCCCSLKVIFFFGCQPSRC